MRELGWIEPAQDVDAGPEAAAFELGLVTGRLEATAAADVLHTGWEHRTDEFAAPGTVAKAARRFGETRKRLRSLTLAAAGGDGRVRVEDALDRFELWISHRDEEASAAKWAGAFYPLDPEERYWHEHFRRPHEPVDRPTVVPYGWDRGEEFAAAVSGLLRLETAPARSFSQEVLRAFDGSHGRVRAAHQLGRLISELEYPAEAWRIELELTADWRWPLERRELLTREERRAVLQELADDHLGQPTRVGDRVRRENARYARSVGEWFRRTCQWRRTRRTIDRGKNPGRRNPFERRFVPIPSRGWAGFGPWELGPPQGTLAAIGKLLVDLDVSLGGLPVPPVERSRGETVYLEDAEAVELNRYAVAVVDGFRSAVRPEKDIFNGPHDIVLKFSTGRVTRRGREVTLTRMQARALLRGLCEYEGSVTMDAVNRRPAWFGFDVEEARAGDTAGARTRGKKSVTADQRRRAVSNLKRDAAGLGIGVKSNATKIYLAPPAE